MDRKTIVILGIIVVITALAGVAGINAKEIPKWKTYKNVNYGYAIKYPENWTCREYPDTKTGAGFRPSNLPGQEYINIDASGTAENIKNMPFDEYVKIAATVEIQNYEKLNSIAKVSTDSGVKGYKTTWICNGWHFVKSKSLPITYFDKNNAVNQANYKSVQLRLDNSKYLDIYNKMLSTFEYITK
jgi:hypothetical protein